MNYQAPPSSVVVSRPSAPETSTGCAVCSGDYEYDYDLPFYYSPFGVFTMFGYLLLVLVGIFIVAQVVLLGLIGIIAYIRQNIIKCPKCKKVFKKENKNLTHCPFCGTELKHSKEQSKKR